MNYTSAPDNRCECTCGRPGCASLTRPHGTFSRYRIGCRCLECTAAANRNAQPRIEARQRETIAAASKAKQMWTGPELEIATRDDLPIRELALMLGRSYKAVQTIRRKCKQDPRKAYLLGAAETPGNDGQTRQERDESAERWRTGSGAKLTAAEMDELHALAISNREDRATPSA